MKQTVSTLHSGRTHKHEVDSITITIMVKITKPGEPATGGGAVTCRRRESQCSYINLPSISSENQWNQQSSKPSFWSDCVWSGFDEGWSKVTSREKRTTRREGTISVMLVRRRECESEGATLWTSQASIFVSPCCVKSASVSVTEMWEKQVHQVHSVICVWRTVGRC